MFASIRMFAVVAALSSAASASVTIQTVPVANLGNAPDPRVNLSDGTSGYGSVSYMYSIGKYEVTAGQYTAFLNAVAATDTNTLYNTNQARTTQTNGGSGISRSGSSGSYAYSVDAAFANRPVNYVNFWDACRFTNWLHNGQPTGPQNASTTEDGAYTLTPTGIANNSITRNAGAQWAVASENEWYKAAYYKGGGTNAGYWLFPTSTDAAPGRDLADPLGNNANYSGTPYPIQSPYYTTAAGQFKNSAGPYGTFDQGGNVWELSDDIAGAGRVYRGGSLGSVAFELRADARSIASVVVENFNVGFRVTQIPAPTSAALLGMLGMRALVRRRVAGK